MNGIQGLQVAVDVFILNMVGLTNKIILTFAFDKTDRRIMYESVQAKMVTCKCRTEKCNEIEENWQIYMESLLFSVYSS